MTTYDVISGVCIGVSNVNDGTMKIADEDAEIVTANRTNLITTVGGSYENSIVIKIDYDTENFCHYKSVELDSLGGGQAYVADGIVTTTRDVALLLPLADCIGAVLYDKEHDVVMVSHLGRHSLEQDGAAKSIRYMHDSLGSKPTCISVFLSPSAGQANYPLFSFEGRSLESVARDQFERAGVEANSIFSAGIDTTLNTRYFSHSEYLKGNRASNGRFAIVAMLRG